MTSDQYTELVGFLGGKFDGIDRRFEAMDRRFDGIERRLDDHDRQFEEVRRHANVLFERAQENFQKVAEGLGLRIDAVGRRLTEVNHRLGGCIDGVEHRLVRLEGAVTTLTDTVRDGFADHEGRIRVLEGTEPAGTE